MTLRIHEWGSYLNNMAYVHKAGPVWLIGRGTATYGAEIVYVPLTCSGKILANYRNADFNGMVDQAADDDGRQEAAQADLRINRLWVDDAAGMPLYQQLDLYGATQAHGLEGTRRRGHQGLRDGREVAAPGPGCRPGRLRGSGGVSSSLAAALGARSARPSRV